jgi:hypothetical protein
MAPDYKAVIYTFSERDSAAGVALADALTREFLYCRFVFDEAAFNGEIHGNTGDSREIDAARAFAKGFVLGMRFQGATRG